MNEYELYCFKIAGKNYSKEELKKKVEIFLRNLIKTNECIRYGENFDPDEDLFQIPITQDIIDLLVDTFNQIDLSTWDALTYSSYRDLSDMDVVADPQPNCYEIILYGNGHHNENISKKYDITNVMITIYIKYKRTKISFSKINKETLASTYISLSDFNDFVRIYNEICND
jgi:hypothetical protein